MTMTLSIKLLTAAIATCTITHVTSSATSGYKYNDNNFHQLQQHLSPDPADILENLDEYSKLWISVPKHDRGNNCVWSECGLDDQTDDGNMGDYRDGDEKWYQYRTQSFCANAAYSLYGIKKSDGSGSWTSGSCNRGHFINSFFTYGGADKLLKAVGVEPEVYYEDYEYDGDERRVRHLEDAANDDANGGGDDDGYAAPSNTNCVEIDYEEQEDEEEEEQAEGEDRHRHRHLSGSGSGDNANNGYSSSLGCSSDGSYIMAAFQGSSCDGNYFLESIDSIDTYNRQHHNIGCHKIWTAKDSNYDAIYSLLKNSWTCDMRLYPNACPDPFQVKGRYEYALRTAAHGGNGMLAYKNEVLRRPLHALSWALVSLAVCVLILTYFVKNQKRIAKERSVANGCVQVVKEDAVSGYIKAREASMTGLVSARVALNSGMDKAKTRIDSEVAKRSPKRNGSKRSGSKRSPKRSGSKRNGSTTARSDEDFVQVQSGVDESHPDYPLQVMEAAQGKDGVVA